MNSSTEKRARGAGERVETGVLRPSTLLSSRFSPRVSRRSVAAFGARLAAVGGALFAIAQGCSSPTQKLANPEMGTGAVTAAPTTNTPATSTPVTQAPSNAEITSCAGPNPDRTCTGVNPDANCNTSDASSEAACTIDCRVECGFNGMGLKHCTCVSGRYESCPCERPDTFQGAATAQFCTQGTGLMDELDETPCATEWEVCIARDVVPGTPRGCACLKNPDGTQEWSCGSTNNWFALQSETGDGICEGATPDPTCAPGNTDMNCNSTNARTGESCSRDCRVACGFQTMGLKVCTCQGGVYSMCPCPKPDDYLGAATAPPCTTLTPDGMTTALDDQACTVEWQQCIGSDTVSGNTPRGCVCMTNRLSGMLQWFCGSTNRWFAPG